MTNYLSTAQTAKLIRKALKEAFPMLPARFFSVRSKNFSMGSSVDITWTDGPTVKEVDAVVGKFKAGSFDGMQDLYEYNGRTHVVDGVEYRSGAKYVGTSRRHSRAAISEAMAMEVDHRADSFTDRGEIVGSDEFGYHVSTNDYTMQQAVHQYLGKRSFVAAAEAA